MYGRVLIITGRKASCLSTRATYCPVTIPCALAFNPLEGWSRDASEDVAHELEQRVAEGHEVTEPVREFIERFTGRPIGVQLLLPLREF